MLRVVAKTRKKLLTVRISPDDLSDFNTAAELQGAKMSTLVHMFVIRTIRDAKERNPEAFMKRRNEYQRPVVTAKTSRTKGKVKNLKR